MTLGIYLISLLMLGAGAAGAILFGQWRWTRRTRAVRERIEAGRLAIKPKVFALGELADLPAPVQRFFRAALMDGQPMVSAVTVAHTGSFNQSETAENWKPFKSTQRVVVRRPGFDWDARIMIWPALTMRVQDAYVGGEGILQVALWGLFSLANGRDTGLLARGELIRFFAEAAWYPTALLPSQGIRWQAQGERSARATLSDGDITVTLLFRFNEEGLIDTVRADARGRTMSESLPWQARMWNFAWRDTMRVPLAGEAAWVTPKGIKPYWRGQITELVYEFAK